MADILIRGMEMPKRCEDCKLRYRHQGFTVYDHCFIDMRNIDPWTFGRERNGDKPEWCPLVPLPEGHGDLIDRDETMNTILGEPTDAHYPSWYAGIVNDMHTIVPAEKEDV